jgi:hypothetical protein
VNRLPRDGRGAVTRSSAYSESRGEEAAHSYQDTGLPALAEFDVAGAGVFEWNEAAARARLAPQRDLGRRMARRGLSAALLG